jgi:hypothetical protein
MRYIMIMLARDVIDLLKNTTRTCIVGCLVFVVVNGGLRLIYLGRWMIHI